MVDIHCHVLPGIDDGAEDWDVAVEMCRMAVQDGVDHVVATPHANDEYSYDREQHEQTLDCLRGMVAGSLQLSLGCDFHLSYENVQSALQTPARYCIGNTPYLLVELSDYALPPNTPEVFARFLNIGVVPIVTHPERNPILQRRPEMVVQWAVAGVLVQITGNSMTGRWGMAARKSAEFLAKKGAVHVLASDAHGTHSRSPVLSEARDVMAKFVGKERARAMVEDNPRAIVSGLPVPYC